MTKKSKHTGIFITFEGGEGAGKSSQIKLLQEKLEGVNFKTLVTREPGGTAGAEAVRHVILSGHAEKMGADVEAMLFAAARADHVERVIRPAINAGKIVLCDRFFDSTRVYQGSFGKVSMELLHSLEHIACDDIWPDLTLILDIPPQEGMKRASMRRKKGDTPDRFEKENMNAQQIKRDAFRRLTEDEPERCKLINAMGTEKQVASRIWKAVKPLLPNKKPSGKPANDR